MVSAILLAGGAGKRMHQSVPKQFLPLAGRPMIFHTLERFERIDTIEEVIVACFPQYKEWLQAQIEAYALRKRYILIDGGNTRQESTYLGLKAAKNDRVLIHEAARPFVTVGEFTALLEEPSEAVTYGAAIPFTVSVVTGDKITGLLERSSLVNIQLPQKFDRAVLLEAHEKALAEGRSFTEDASLLYHYTGTPVKVLRGSAYNVKITDDVDLLTGEIIYKEYIIGRD